MSDKPPVEVPMSELASIALSGLGYTLPPHKKIVIKKDESAQAPPADSPPADPAKTPAATPPDSTPAAPPAAPPATTPPPETTPPAPPKADDKDEDEESAPWAVELASQTREIAEQVAEMKRATASAGTPPPPKQDEDLTPAQRRDLEILNQLEEMKPDQYKGITTQFKRFIGWLDTYRAQWEREHPGQEFDPSDDEHSVVIDARKPTFDDDDFDDARIELKLQRREKQRLDKENEQRSRQSLEERVQAHRKHAPVAMLNMADEELGKKFETEGGKVFSDSPAAASAFAQSSRVVNAWLASFERIIHGKAELKPDQLDPVASDVVNFIFSYEDMLKSNPDKAKRGGKRFATIEEMNTMPEQKRAGYWSLGPDDVRGLIVRYHADQFKSVLGAIRGAPKTSPTPTPPQPTTPPQPSAGQSAPKTPTTETSQGKINPDAPGVGGGDSLGKKIVAAMFQ